MKIELKNVRIMQSLSEETHCYTATVYVDGQKAFEASNHGHGGADFYRPVKGYTGPSEQEIDAWLKANREPMQIDGMSLAYTLELEVGELLDKHLFEQDRKRVEKRLRAILSKSVAALRDGKLVTWKVAPTEKTLAAVRAKFPDVEIVNGAEDAVFRRALTAYCPDLVA